MTIAAGSRLGSYEIVSPIGAGGMGEVYRARDARLGRDVAIKVLPATVAEDTARRQRFEQEARSASALNHPNILTVYDIGSVDGTLYIAMELIEGKTMRELIAGEPLPVRRQLDLSAQIADGLAKAHAAGIVHRDLKPENLMVSKDGFVKILDFGLAKLTEIDAQQQSALPTAVAKSTEPGTVMGTAGYMSPEQASGQSVDFRSDQFSFGSILYEMATGKKAFARKTGAETLVAIIREEPEPLSQLAPKAPAPVRWIVERCLAKDPEERYASTKDLARDLKSVRDHLSETSASGALEAAERTKAKTRRRGWLLPAAAALLAGAGLALILQRAAAGRPDSPIRFQQLTFQRGTIFSARFARDGQTIFFGASWDGGPLQIYSTRADSTQSRAVALPAADVLAVSPAGEMAISLGRHFTVGFQTTGMLARAPLEGGAPREIVENVVDADWSPDGKSLAVARFADGRYRLEYPVGKVLYQATAWLSHVRVSPDGALVAFLDHPEVGDSLAVVKVVDTAGHVRLTGPSDRISLAWSPDGSEVWSSAPLEATSLSGKTRTLWSSSGLLDRIVDVARDGRVLFLRASARREIAGVDAEGKQRNLTWFEWSYPSDVSADGRSVLFDEQSAIQSRIFVRKLDGSPAVHIADGKSFAFSPDGRLALVTSQLGMGRLSLVPTGAGEARVILDGSLSVQWASFTPDGRRVVFTGIEPGHAPRLYVIDAAGGKPRAASPEGIGIGPGHAVSPDGKRIAILGTDGKIVLAPIDSSEEKSTPLAGARPEEVAVRWTTDGRGIYVFRPDMPGHLDVVDIATGARRTWREVLPPDPAGVSQIEPFVVSENGTAFIYSYRRLLDELQLVTGIH